MRRKAFLHKWRLKCRAVAASLEEAGEALFAFTRLPPGQWKSARTTNAIERPHEEFKRRIKTQTVLPSAETAAKPPTAVLQTSPDRDHFLPSFNWLHTPTHRSHKAMSVLAWARQPAGAPGHKALRRLVDQLACLRAVGLDPACAEGVHPERLRKLAREGGRYTAQHGPVTAKLCKTAMWVVSPGGARCRAPATAR